MLAIYALSTSFIGNHRQCYQFLKCKNAIAAVYTYQ